MTKSEYEALAFARSLGRQAQRILDSIGTHVLDAARVIGARVARIESMIGAHVSRVLAVAAYVTRRIGERVGITTRSAPPGVVTTPKDAVLPIPRYLAPSVPPRGLLLVRGSAQPHAPAVARLSPT